MIRFPIQQNRAAPELLLIGRADNQVGPEADDPILALTHAFTMIHDTLTNARLYLDLHPGIRKGLEFLSAFDPETPDSRIDIDGDDVFALVQSYQTTPSNEKRYEGHRVYADIQYLISGDEIIVCAPVSRLSPETEYDTGKDFLLYSDTEDAIDLILRPGDFAIFLPDDAHKPGCNHRGQSSARKVVVKVRL